MTDAPMTRQEEDDALAAEYVLGVLDLAERTGVEARMKSDTAFAGMVAAWEQRLFGLNDAYDVAAAPDLLPKIEARLFPTPAAPKRSWRGWFAGLGMAAAVAAAVTFVALPRQDLLIANLSTADSSLTYQASFDGTTLTVSRLTGAAAPAGQVHELWIIAPNAAPVSLGLLDSLPLAVAYPKPPAGWVLAVSVEPAGGSPTGAPTGPVILTREIGA